MQIIYLRNNNTGDLYEKIENTHTFYFTCKFDWFMKLWLQNFNYARVLLLKIKYISRDIW